MENIKEKFWIDVQGNKTQVGVVGNACLYADGNNEKEALANLQKKIQLLIDYKNQVERGGDTLNYL